MRKNSLVLVIFFWCEIIFAARILAGGLGFWWAHSIGVEHFIFVQDAITLTLVSLLAALYFLAGLAGLQGRATIRSLHVAAALGTLVVCSRSLSGSIMSTGSVNIFSLVFSLYSLWVIYFFTFRFLNGMPVNQGAKEHA